MTAHLEALAQTNGCTLDEVRTWPATVSVATACRPIGISPSWGYQLAAEGQFPCRVLRIGGRTRVLTTSLIGLLETGKP